MAEYSKDGTGDIKYYYIDENGLEVVDPNSITYVQAANFGLDDTTHDAQAVNVGHIDQVQYPIVNMNDLYNYNIGSSVNNSLYNGLLSRLKEFHQWLNDEQPDLEEECGSDLSGIIDKLEETFSELCTDEHDQYLEYFGNSVRSALGVNDET